MPITSLRALRELCHWVFMREKDFHHHSADEQTNEGTLVHFCCYNEIPEAKY
jgi:hypothetical protein